MMMGLVVAVFPGADVVRCVATLVALVAEEVVWVVLVVVAAFTVVLVMVVSVSVVVVVVESVPGAICRNIPLAWSRFTLFRENIFVVFLRYWLARNFSPSC